MSVIIPSVAQGLLQVLLGGTMKYWGLKPGILHAKYVLQPLEQYLWSLMCAKDKESGLKT